MSFLKEFWAFLKQRKKLWLLPILLVIGILGVLIFVTSNPTISPFIYTLF